MRMSNANAKFSIQKLDVFCDVFSSFLIAETTQKQMHTNTLLTFHDHFCSAMRLSGKEGGPMVQQKQQREKLPTAQPYRASDSPFSD